MEVNGLLVSVIVLVIAIAMMLAQFRLFSIDTTLKHILAELQKGAQSPAPPEAESEAELGRRRAAIAEGQTNWPGYK
jgi:hypothetical protein